MHALSSLGLPTGSGPGLDKKNLAPLLDLGHGLPQSTAAWSGFLHHREIPDSQFLQSAFLEATPRYNLIFSMKDFPSNSSMHMSTSSFPTLTTHCQSGCPHFSNTQTRNNASRLRVKYGAAYVSSTAPIC